MMDLSHINILEIIPGTYKRVASTNGGEYAGACPFCGGTDRFRIWDAPQDGSHPNWWCRKCDRGGDVLTFLAESGMSFMQAAAHLGLQPDGMPNGTTTAQRGYEDGQEYAEQHGLDWEDLAKCGWIETTYQDRPALEFETSGGKRWRFLDGNSPKYISEKGFTRSWYGLSDKVIRQAKETSAPLFVCNGETSMIAARFWGVPAITIAGGAEKRIPDDLLDTLFQQWDGTVAIVMDCDEHGRKAAQLVDEQLGERGVVIDLGLSDGQDLADYVRLHGSHSLKTLKALIPLPADTPITSREAAQLVTSSLDINSKVEGKPIIMPFSIYHGFGGYALVGMPGKLTGVGGASGHGKTSWLNSGIDTLLRRGDNGVGVMPEFDNEEYQWDRIQRYSGFNNEPFVTAEQMMLWKLWRWEHQNNVPYAERMGYELTKDERRVVTHINNMVEGWSGQFKLYPLETSLEDTLIQMGDYILSRKGTAQEVTFAAFDYIQILNVRGTPDDDNVHEFVMGVIKKFCMRYKIHGFVSSQVNKTADKSARSTNKILGSTDMRYARDDKVNCMITLNPVYDEVTGEIVQVPGTGCYAARANIVKNNKGRKGIVNQLVDFRHLTWLDQSYENNVVDLYDDEENNEPPF